MQILISLIGFLVAITILVGVHEFGHFWVARRFGIKVLRFSIGFGRPFFNWYDRKGTEYVLSMIPLGGYVALYGERTAELPTSERRYAFSYKPIPVRISVLLAGPLFNFLFAIIAYWAVFMIGITGVVPVLGHIPADSPAALAGLHHRDEIVSIDGRKTLGWEDVSVALISALGEKHAVHVTTRPFGSLLPLKSHTLDLSGIEHDGGQGDFLKELGLQHFDPVKPVVGEVLEDMPAGQAGIKKDDKIIMIDNHRMEGRSDVLDYVQSHNGKAIIVKVERNHEILDLPLTPVAKLDESGKAQGFMGITFKSEKPPQEYLRKMRLGPVAALQQSLKQTLHYTVLTLKILKKMLVGTLSVKHLSGPISIAQYAGQTVSIGFVYFVNFLALISISLGIINLLPIPLLDGGNIVYCIWESISGRPLSEHAQIVGFLDRCLDYFIHRCFGFL